jgi:hypothetical protein
MDPFPSSWIITPKESGRAQSSLSPQPCPPSPTPSNSSLPFEEPVPLRRRKHARPYRHYCECDGMGHHDDIYPLSKRDYPPFPKDYPDWPIFFRHNVSSHLTPGYMPRSRSPYPLRQHYSANYKQLRRSPSITSTLLSFTETADDSPPPSPHPEPYSHYSTHFPSAWILPGPAKHEADHSKWRLSSASSADPDIGQLSFPANSKSKPTSSSKSPAAISRAKASSPQPSSASKLPIKLPIRRSVRRRVEATPTPIIPNGVAKTNPNPYASSVSTEKALDLMAELKGEPPQVDKGEQIGIWVERVSRHGSFPSSTNDMVIIPLGSGLDPKSKEKAVNFGMEIDMAFSDASGLGDAPHVTQAMHENYSIYSESTNKS